MKQGGGMMKWLCLFIFFSVTIGLFVPAYSDEAPRMTKEGLKALLGNPDLIIIDVRHGRDWTNSDTKIQGAVREDPDDSKSWANKYSPDKAIVFY
jgi:hypothetical protein